MHFVRCHIQGVAQVQWLRVFSLQIGELPRDCQWKGSICQRQSWEGGGRAGETSGRGFCGSLTARRRFLLTEVNGSPKLGSSASGTRQTSLFCWKFRGVAVLFSVRKQKNCRLSGISRLSDKTPLQWLSRKAINYCPGLYVIEVTMTT